LEELIEHLQKQYQVNYGSLQSYYQLFSDAGISWHKGVKKNPKQDLEQVKTINEEIHQLLETNQSSIQSGEIAAFVIDECHLMSGDICGYGWGARQERRTVDVKNYRDRQTYYGAVDLFTQELLIKKAKTADGLHTVNFMEYLQSQRPNSRLLIIWDGASYHRGEEFRNYLTQVNQQHQQVWQIHCQRFAPHAPEENPIENIWSQVKNFLKRFYSFCKSFSITKRLFELFIDYQLFTMPNLNHYDAFSHLF
jgi:putative transposase